MRVWSIVLAFLLSVLVVLRAEAQTSMQASYQSFERGFMLYLSDGTIFAFMDEGGGSGKASLFGPAQYGPLANDPVKDKAPSGLYKPILGFGKVWGYNAAVRQGLGWATAPEKAYSMLRSSSGVTATFNLPNGKAVKVRQGAWQYTTPLQIVMTVTPSVGCSRNGVGTPSTCATVTPAPTQITPAPSATPDLGCSRTGGGTLPICPATILTPTGPVIETQAAFQWFDGGFMIWRADTEEILVFPYQPNAVLRYPLDRYASLPDNPVTDTPPQYGVKPINGFGRVWGNFPTVRDALGWGSSIELGYTLKIAPVGESFCLTRVDQPQEFSDVLLAPNGRWTDQNVVCGF
jgi:hypothetical protein